MNRFRQYIQCFCCIAVLLGASRTAEAKKGIDTFHIYYDINVSALSKNMQRKVDLLVYNGRILNGSEIRIVGYADYLGTEQHNRTLSMDRARILKNYLVQNGINAGSITVCVGKGEVKRQDMTAADGNQDDRKVDIVVNNNINTSEKWDKTIKPKTPAITTGTDISQKNNGNGNGNGSGGGGNSAGPGTDKDVVELPKLKVGQTILLRNVYFPAGSHVIKPESYNTLANLYQTLVTNPKVQINIEGHVCCIHDVPDAMDVDTDEPLLSVNRARAIYDYLINRGISSDRLKYQGFGKSHPVVANERTEQDAERNRRVEIRVTGN